MGGNCAAGCATEKGSEEMCERSGAGRGGCISEERDVGRLCEQQAY